VVVCAAIGLVSAAVLRVALQRRNKSRDLAEEANGTHMMIVDGDLTDKQNPHFRYAIHVKESLSSVADDTCAATLYKPGYRKY
jgi:hypothetical protein